MTGKRQPQIFEPEYYARLFEIEERHWWAVGMRRAMQALLAQPLQGRDALRLLDVGCGTGFLLGFMKEHWPVKTAAGVDLSEYALQFCRTRGETMLAKASATALPFADGSFDLLTCIDTLQHLPVEGDAAALKEFFRVLRPGGLVYVRSNSALGHYDRYHHHGSDYRRYTLSTLATLFRSTGFAVDRASYLNFVPGAWGALKERVRSKQHHGHSADEGHHHTPGLAISMLPRWLTPLNAAFRALSTTEAAMLRRKRFSFRFGHATAIVASKPNVSGA